MPPSRACDALVFRVLIRPHHAGLPGGCTFRFVLAAGVGPWGRGHKDLALVSGGRSSGLEVTSFWLRALSLGDVGSPLHEELAVSRRTGLCAWRLTEESRKHYWGCGRGWGPGD